jgi:penicillin G amidase
MFTLFRWLLRIFAIFAALAVLVGFGVYFFLARSLPDYSESFTLGAGRRGGDRAQHP